MREFGDRLYHVHAKDMEIDRDGLYERGSCQPDSDGRSRGCRVSVRSAGIASSLRSTRRATTTPSSSSTRIDQFEGSDEKIKAGFVIASNAVLALRRVIRAS